MAKPLHRPPPSSSIARLLDQDAAARAIAAPPSEPGVSPVVGSALSAPAIPRAEVCVQPRTIKRELTLTVATDETLTQLVDLYRRSTGTRLSTSHVARAMLRAVAYCMGSVEREARRIGRRKLPANAPGCETQRERFEHRLAQALVNGIRTAPSVDFEET